MIEYSPDIYKILYRNDVDATNFDDVVPWSVIKCQRTGVRRNFFYEIRDGINARQPAWCAAIFSLSKDETATIFRIPRRYKYRGDVCLACVRMDKHQLIHTLEKIFKLGAFL